jgi:hypothetical protein
MSIIINQNKHLNAKPLVKCTFIKKKYIWMVEVFNEYDIIYDNENNKIGLKIKNYTNVEMKPDIVYKYLEYIYRLYDEYSYNIEIKKESLHIKSIYSMPNKNITDLMNIIQESTFLIDE